MMKVLFVCFHNSARSQMGEAFLNRLSDGLFIAESAGLEEGHLNPYVVDAMNEVRIDISQNKTDRVFDFFKEGREYSFVIKVCDEINGQRCPVFPQTLHTMNWNLEDPSSFEGSDEEIMTKTREIRDQILEKVKDFIREYKDIAKSRK